VEQVLENSISYVRKRQGPDDHHLQKLAALAVSLGESTASAKYLEKAEELMKASPDTQKVEDMNPEQKKEHLEEQGALAFQ